MIRKDLAFPESEFKSRLNAVRRRMVEKKLDALMVTIPENICYLSGFQTPGYYYLQVLMITPDQDPRIVVRHFEGKNVDAYSWLDPINRSTFQDNEDPTAVVAGVIKSLKLEHKIIGIELNSWYLTVRHFEALKSSLPETRFVDASGTVEIERRVKSPLEIEKIKKACRMAEAGLQAAIDLVSTTPVLTENDLAAAIHYAMSKMGSEYPGLPVFLGSGHRSVIPHVSATEKAIEVGDNIIIELTGVVRRYAGPLFRTLFKGTPPQEFLDRAEAVKEMLDATIEAIRPGTTSHKVNEAAVKAGNRYSAGITKRAGYSVGINFPPDWGEGYLLDLKDGDETVLQPGMTFHIPQSLRPEGLLPVAISETVMVSESGAEVLTHFPRKLFVFNR
jgi:Xaa-Pro dipeptidase